MGRAGSPVLFNFSIPLKRGDEANSWTSEISGLQSSFGGLIDILFIFRRVD